MTKLDDYCYNCTNTATNNRSQHCKTPVNMKFPKLLSIQIRGINLPPQLTFFQIGIQIAVFREGLKIYHILKSPYNF